MDSKTSSHVKPESGRVAGNNGARHRSAPHIKLVPDLQLPMRDALDLLGAELRNDSAPLADGGRTNPYRPRDIRGSLKVIQNVLLEHGPKLTGVHPHSQPRSTAAGLTLVNMNDQGSLKERLQSALEELRKVDRKASAAALARFCGLTKAGVGKWFSGETTTLEADNYVCAAKYLRVRSEWLRTGKLPRDPDGPDLQAEEVFQKLEALREPLANAVRALEQLAISRQEPKKTRRK